MRFSSSGMPFSLRTGRVTRYTIWPVGTGGPGFPSTTSRHVEFNPTIINHYMCMCLHSELTIRRDNQIGRVAFSLLCDERGTVRVDFDDAAVKVQYDAESGGTLE